MEATGGLLAKHGRYSILGNKVCQLATLLRTSSRRRVVHVGLDDYPAHVQLAAPAHVREDLEDGRPAVRVLIVALLHQVAARLGELGREE